MLIDFSHLTIGQIATLLFALTALDFLSGLGGAIAHGTFSLAVVADFVNTHVLERVVPLTFAAAIGQGDFGLPAIAPVFVIFLAGVAAYVAETVASIANNLGTSATPAATQDQSDTPGK